jgi:magnesium-transporting ATPase (P-type)
MAQASTGSFGKQVGQCGLAAIVLFLIAFAYLQSLAGESNPGVTASKIVVMVLLFLVSNAAQILIVARSAHPGFLSVVSTNLGIWLLFFVLLSIDAVKVHPGLAKDAVTTIPASIGFFLVQFTLLGLPMVLVNTVIGVVVARRFRWSPLSGAPQ